MARRLRSLQAQVGVLAALASLLAGCSATTGKSSLLTGTYSGVVRSDGSRVLLLVYGDGVKVNGTDATLDDPTTTAAFHLGDGPQKVDFTCAMQDDDRSTHCTITVAVRGNATPCPTASSDLRCSAVSPHLEVDLLRICSGYDCR